MQLEEIILLAAFLCLYIGIPAGMICWVIFYLLRRRHRRDLCRNTYLNAECRFKSQLLKMLDEGLALDANIWRIPDTDVITPVFFELLFESARTSKPILLPDAVKNSILEAHSGVIPSAEARLQKFQRAGLLMTHKDGQPLKPEDCPVTIQSAMSDNDLFKRKIDYQLLTKELASAYSELLKANIR